jgi:predicted ribosome quality control (RQC) complex YloA/Tae2 family protein
VIAALSSWQKQAKKAQVICAQVKNVRKIKGAALGQVLVDQVEETLLVEMDESLEERLRLNENTGCRDRG